MSSMPKKRPPHIRREKNRHGIMVWYFRKDNGPRIRLPDTYGTNEFWEAYNDALLGTIGKATKKAQGGTVRWLVARYRESGHYQSLRPTTRRMRDNVLKRLCDDSGDIRFADIRRRHIQEAVDRRAKTPGAANNFLKILRKMFEWAVVNEMVEANPCEGVSGVNSRTDGHHTWTVEEVERFRQKYALGTRERLALDLLLFTGLRIGDIVRLGRQHVSGNVISIRTEKTGIEISIPIFPDLQASIDATKTGDMVFLTTGRGLAFSSSASFGNWFRKACVGAKVPGRAHGLRKAGATIAAEAGATAHELMAMFGWGKLEMAETYTKKADRARLARGAAERIANRFSPHRASGEIMDQKKETKSGA